MGTDPLGKMGISRLRSARIFAPVVIAAVRGADQVAKRAPWRATDVYIDICGVLDADYVMQHKTNEIGEVVQECISSANI